MLSTFDHEIEKSYLSGVAADPGAAAEQVANLNSKCFHRPAHKACWRAFKHVVESGGVIELGSLRSALEGYGDLSHFEECGLIVSHAMTAANVILHRRRLEHLLKVRCAAEALAASQAAIAAENCDIDALLSSTSQRFSEIQSEGHHDVLEALPDVARRVAQDAESRMANGFSGATSGFLALDKRITGFEPGEMIVVGARTGMGKTVLALNMAMHNAKLGRRVIFFALEMSSDQLAKRIMATTARVNAAKIRRGNLSEQEVRRFTHAQQDFKNINLELCDSARTLSQIESKLRLEVRKEAIDLVVIDYLQLLNTEGGRTKRREEVVADQSRRCKQLALELGIPIMVVVQINRGAEQRDNKRPRISDIRDSGSIEQDADMILLIYREDAYAESGADHTNVAEVNVAKFRAGEPGVVKLAWEGRNSLFKDLSTQRDDEEAI